MPIAEIRLPSSGEALPNRIANFLAAADQLCDEFFDTGANKTMPRFLPADYASVYQAIKGLQTHGALLGNRFCEWGSGLGTATCLAALAGFEAHGIEIEEGLVERAKELAKVHGIDATFIESSFLPEGFDFLHTQGGRELLKPRRTHCASYSYEDMDWELEEVDLFYVYPWPEEQESTLALFDAVATEGAYLICYYGEGETCVYRKE